MLCARQGAVAHPPSTKVSAESICARACQVQQYLALDSTERRRPETARLGQTLQARAQGPSTLPQPLQHQGVQDPWRGRQHLGEPSRGASRSRGGQGPNWPPTMAPHRIKQCWINLRHLLWVRQLRDNLGMLVRSPTADGSCPITHALTHSDSHSVNNSITFSA